MNKQIYINWSKNNRKLFSSMLNLQTNCSSNLHSHKEDQHTLCKLLIHDTEHHKDNQFQFLELPCRINILVDNTTFIIFYFININEFNANIFNALF